MKIVQYQCGQCNQPLGWYFLDHDIIARSGDGWCKDSEALYRIMHHRHHEKVAYGILFLVVLSIMIGVLPVAYWSDMSALTRTIFISVVGGLWLWALFIYCRRRRKHPKPEKFTTIESVRI